MTKRIFLLPILLVVLSINTNIYAQITGIKGEGEVVTQELKLDAFDGISMSIAAEVIITQGSPQKVVVEAQQNIIDNLKKAVRSDTWHIEFEKNVREAKPVIVRITIPKLEDIALTGSGKIRTQGAFKNQSDMDIALSGSGIVDITTEVDEVDVHLSGSGKIMLAGAAKELEIAISGSGKITATDMTANECEVHISGSGDAMVNVTNTLSTAISGSGDVQYKGSPSVKASIVGSGEVTKIN